MPFNDILLIISVIMSALSVILVAGVLKNTKSKTNDALEQKIDFLNKNIGDEFHRIRVENQSANKEIREDVKKSLDDMNLRIDNMNPLTIFNTVLRADSILVCTGKTISQ